MRYFIVLSYNGKAYHGWQRQPNAITVQEILEQSLSTLLKDPIIVVGAGRTDTGVHAKEYVAHFDFDKLINETELIVKLNSFLPSDIAVSQIYRVKEDVHARFNALSRTYNYRISTKKDVFNSNFAYGFYLPLNVKKMNAACRILLEYTNFKCFSKSKTQVHTYNCNITHAEWRVIANELVFYITADRFLRNMVRAIVGTMIAIGLEKISVNELHQIIHSQDRKNAGFSVPAYGLYLTHILYPDTIKY